VQRGRPGQRSTLFDICVDVNSVEMERVEFEEIEVTEEDAHRIREIGSSPDIFRLITASIAPSIYGMHVEKEALALQLFGGVAKVMPDGRRIRGDIHLILVGDPGTGKSELLSYMIRLSPRGIYATGKAASAAGLTAAAVRDEFGEGRWTLEAGALVLADLGLAAIDEIEKMIPQDRTAIASSRSTSSKDTRLERSGGDARRASPWKSRRSSRNPSRPISTRTSSVSTSPMRSAFTRL